MREGLALVLRHAFVTMRLHRIEAQHPARQPRLVGPGPRRRLQPRGLLPRYLKIGGRWRDHERWALLADDWRNRAELADARKGFVSCR